MADRDNNDNHRQIVQALYSLSKTTLIDRNVRTLVNKISKTVERQQVVNASYEMQIQALEAFKKRQQAKHKKRQSINPNKVFVDLVDVRMGSIEEAAGLNTLQISQAVPHMDSTTSNDPLMTLREAVNSVTSCIFDYRAV